MASSQTTAKPPDVPDGSCVTSVAGGCGRTSQRLGVTVVATVVLLSTRGTGPLVRLFSPDPEPAAVSAFNGSDADADAKFDARDQEIFRYVVDWLETPTSTCRSLRWLGGQLEGPRLRLTGGRPVCMDASLSILSSDSCLVYSFGLEAEYTFEEAMVQLGCEVYAFDPMMEQTDAMVTAGIRFRRAGLYYRSGMMNGFQMLSFDDIVFHTGHDGWPVQYLKLDVAATELSFLLQQLTDWFGGAFVLDTVEQMLLEVHLPADLTPPTAIETLDNLELSFRALTALGFSVVHSEADLAESARLYRYPGVGRPFHLVRQVLLVRNGPDRWPREERKVPSRS